MLGTVFPGGVYCVDFEFQQTDGGLPHPHCLVAREVLTGRLIRLFGDELDRSDPPYPTGPDALFVAYYASAEIGCHLALGWKLPERVVDLYAEFRCHNSGLTPTCGFGLLGALIHHGLPAVEVEHKKQMQLLGMRGGPYSDEERRALLDYCQSDVDALRDLLGAMGPRIDLPRALLRGRYMLAVARIERQGIPMDVDILAALRGNWDTLKLRLIEDVDRDYGVYEGASFRLSRFEAFLVAKDIPWPRLDSGALATSDDTFKAMARIHPVLLPLRELRRTLGELRLNKLTVGNDGRNRLLLSAFASKTGRNQPSNSKFIFGTAKWLRGLIRPEPGCALAYVDWEQQEFGIAARLSRDSAMTEAYESGDPYLAFAFQAGAVPRSATKQSHPEERSQFKVCSLAVQYGMGSKSLALDLDGSVIRARELLQLHRETYPAFWRWSDMVQDHAMLHGFLEAAFGWRVHVGEQANPRSLRNFPMQANGAEMLRIAACLLTERGIQVCALVHDAVLIEARADEIDEVVAATRAIMAEASAIVLDGFRLRSDAAIVRYPDRYSDGGGADLWARVMRILREVGALGKSAGEEVRSEEVGVQI